MRNDIRFEDYSNDVNNAIKIAIINALEEASGELEAQTKKNTKVKTGRTRDSWEHMVDEENYVAYVGSNYENAIWEEFGTGVYAQKGNGRKTPWVYPVLGKRDEDGRQMFRRTKGKKGRKALQNAYKSLKNRIESFFKERFNDL